jgi:signal transduction histidine kinase
MVAAPTAFAESSAETRRRLTLALVVGLGALASIAVAFDAGRTSVDHPDPWAVTRGVVVAAYTAAGAYTWSRRPASRLGAYLLAVPLLYSVASLGRSHDPLAHSTGRLALGLFVVYLAYVLLCFPRDRLTTPAEQRAITFLALPSAVAWLLAVPLVTRLPPGGPLSDCTGECPRNAFRVATPSAELSAVLSYAVTGVTALGLVGVSLVLLTKTRSAPPLLRRFTAPVFCSAALLAINYSAYTILRHASGGDADLLRVLGAASAIAVPVGFFVGEVRGRVFATTGIGRLVTRLGHQPVTPAAVEELLRDAVGDPRLTIALSVAGDTGYVDVHGRPIDLPRSHPDLGVAVVTRHGPPVAAVIHDAALGDGDTIDGVAATALMLLHNAELIDELRASRARIVSTTQTERLRLERNLHDGAQQRLLLIQMKLNAAHSSAVDEGLMKSLEEVEADVAAAAAELVELAHGLYPTALRERGLADALRASARTAAVPVTVVDHDLVRLPPTIEEAVYFCILEAVQNAAKHGGPGTRATVTLERRAREFAFSIADDGRGFDRQASIAGMGILSMRDRIGAIGGELTVESLPGHGTTVRGLVPVAGAQSG